MEALCGMSLLDFGLPSLNISVLVLLPLHMNQTKADQPQHGFKCHVMIAGESGTVCDESSINKMKEIMLPGNKSRLFLYRYRDAGHSIHSSAYVAFMKDLKNIISSALRK